MIGCVGKPKSVDQLEALNRGVYGFNKVADRIIIKPVARVYEALIPKSLQRMVGNFFQNILEIPNVANDILQGDLKYACHDTARFILNSTWGFVGIFDAAARGKLARHRQDFGITLAKWGYTESSYLVLPILGPSTVRDTIGLGVTYFMWPPAYLESNSIRNGLLALNYVDTKAALLKIEPVIGESIDEYVFVRNAYLQNRQYKIKGKSAAPQGVEELLEGPPE